MKIKIADVKIKNRLREDLGDLTPLQKSIKKVGLIHPITITSNYELICGHRRLEACKNIGMDEIEAIIRDDCTKDQLARLELECHENLGRLEFTNAEFEKFYDRKRKYQNVPFWMKIIDFFRNLFEKIFGRKPKS